MELPVTWRILADVLEILFLSQVTWMEPAFIVPFIRLEMPGNGSLIGTMKTITNQHRSPIHKVQQKGFIELFAVVLV